MSTRTLLILACLALLLGTLVVAEGETLRLPGNHRGFEPGQPIAFSHRLHAGELAIDCLYCHYGAERSRHAGIPAASVCMNCHRTVKAPWATVQAEAAAAKTEKREPRNVVSPELQKLQDAVDRNVPIAWVRVHQMPDFVAFDHRPHVNGGVGCDACHGPVRTMERVRQFSDLSMGWCLDCHRGGATARAAGLAAPNASTDCAVCHY